MVQYSTGTRYVTGPCAIRGVACDNAPTSVESNEQPSLDIRSSSAPVPSYSTEPRSRTTQSIISSKSFSICPWTLLSWTAADVTRADRAFVRIRMHDTCNSVRGKLQTARQSSAHWQRACAHSLARPPTRHPALHPAPRVSTMESMQESRMRE